jgi:uncharacterized protein
VAVLVGPRQSGKSSFLDHHAEPGRRLVTLDDLAMRESAQRDPAQFLDALGSTATIDEAQYAPVLFPELKRRVDAMKKATREGKDSTAISYWLTGSNRLLLDREVVESLAGRASYYRFHPLSLGEITRAFGPQSLATLVMRGGWPELWTRTELDTVAYLNDHIQTTLEKDLVRTAGIEKVNEFLRVLRLLAARAGGLFNASEIARDAGVRSSTVSEWVSFVERMLYLVEVPALTASRTTRLIKAPKYYFYDTALMVRLQGWSQAEPVLCSPNIGAVFENLVVSEIAKTRDVHRRTWEISHFRTKEKEEVDLVVSDGQTSVGIECKISALSAAQVSVPKAFQAAVDAKKFFAVSFDSVSQRLPAGTTECVSVFDLPQRLLQTLS